MATDIVSLLTHDEIPIKLRCARCNELALSAFRLPCCDQSICEACRTTLPEECPVCAHSPLSPDDCKPNKNLRLTVKAFLKNEEKKRERAAAAAAAAATATSVKVSDEPLDTQQMHDGPPQLEIYGGMDQQVPKVDEVTQHTEETIEPTGAQTEETTRGELSEEQNNRYSEAPDEAGLKEDIVITTGFEQTDEAKPDSEQEYKEDQEDAQSQHTSTEQNQAFTQFGFGNGLAQGMNWNPAMMQQMMAMQNSMNAGNWGSFPMMGMNMDPSMMNQMMGGMYMGNNSWGWNQQQQQQQQQHGMGGMRMDNMMNVGGNFNATGSYGSPMANFNNGGAGYNAQLMSQSSASAFQQPSRMMPNAGHRASNQAGNGAGGTGSGEEGSANNEFLPGDASDSRPVSPIKGADSAMADAPEDADRDADMQNGQAVLPSADDGSGASMMPYHVDGQQMTPYVQDDPSMMYPQMPQAASDFAYGNGFGYGSRGRAGFRGRALFRGRGGRAADADPVVALTGSSIGQGVAGAPTGPRAMREPQRGMSSSFRGGRGGAIAARGGLMSPPTGPRGPDAASAARTDEHLGQDLDGRRSKSRSRSTSSRRDYDEGRRRRSHHRGRSSSVNGHGYGASHREEKSDHESRTRESSARRYRDKDDESRRGSRRHSLTRSDASDEEQRHSNHRAARDYRTRSRSRSRSRGRTRSRSANREKDAERRRHSSRHHDDGGKSRNRARERKRRRHRTRSASPDRNVAEPDNQGGQRSSRRRRRREERRRERDRDRDREKLPTKESGFRHDGEKDENHKSDRHEPRDSRTTHVNGESLMFKAIPTGPRGDAALSIPTGPRADIPTGPRSQVQQQQQQQPQEFKIHGRGAASGNTHRRPSHGQQVSAAPAEKYVDAHAQEREARNRERMLKEQQRRGSALTTSQQQKQQQARVGSSSSSKRRASRDGEKSRKRRGRGGGGARYGDDFDNDDEQRARRIEDEREAARWE